MASSSCWIPPARLAIALSRAGFTVKVVCPPRHPVRATSVLREAYDYSALAPLRSLARAIAAAKPDLIVPCDDPATQQLHRLYHHEVANGKAREGLCSLIERSLGSPESFSKVYARSVISGVAAEAGVRAPVTKTVRDLHELRRGVETLGFPAVLKTNGSAGGAGVKIVHTMEDAEHAFHALHTPPHAARAAKRAFIDNDWTLIWPSIRRRRAVVNLQAYVPGREATSAVACWKGAVLAVIHFEVLHKMYPTGPATALKRIEHPEMSGGIEKMVRRLNLSGIHGFDFMLEAETGEPHLIELNPRAPQVGHLAFGPGCDLPGALYTVLTGDAAPSSPALPDDAAIALFPHEWIRDPMSPVLREGHHDVPWEEPGLVTACVGRRSGRVMRNSMKKRAQALPAIQISRVKAS